MKKVVNFLIRLFSPSTRKIILSINPQVFVLYAQIKGIEEMTNKVEAIVNLFQVISPIQDNAGFEETLVRLKKLNRKNDKDVIAALEALQLHFKNAGRDLCGKNRTIFGMKVTSDRVYLGGVYGLFTNKASYWLKNKEKLEKDFRFEISLDPEYPVTNWWIINDHLCARFVNSHTSGILKNLDILKLKVA